MIVFADDKVYGETLFPGKSDWSRFAPSTSDSNLCALIQRFYHRRPVYTKDHTLGGKWTHAFVVKHAPSSHFDHLIALRQNNVKLPDGILCLAGSGRKFHGQKKRSWSAVKGNIHLSVYLSPCRAIKSFHTGFPVLAAVSLIQALDSFEELEGRAMIKWVNDIFINESKVAGFLVHTQSMDSTVCSAILGIGINVEKTPRLEPDPFVPKIDSLRSYVGDPLALNQEKVLRPLLRSLDNNYTLLLNGQYFTLFKAYRERSLVLGRYVKIVSDTPGKIPREIARGKIEDIGANLELFLKGHKRPVTAGRLILI